MVDPHDNKTMEINVMADGISVERLKGVMQDPANSSTRFVFNDYAQGALLSLLSLLMNMAIFAALLRSKIFWKRLSVISMMNMILNLPASLHRQMGHG